jgi:hypothetical protein
MPELMTHDEYSRWWGGIGWDTSRALENPAATLAAHVMALQERIDKLLSPDDHDKLHGQSCRCMATQCACAYDHPGAVCMTHREAQP